MRAIEYPRTGSQRHSLKQRLVAAVANGDELTATEIRQLLKPRPTEVSASDAEIH